MTLPDPGVARSTVLVRLAAAIVAIASLLHPGVPDAQDLQVIELRFRLAEDILPALQPLLEPGGVLSGMDAVLFVRTSPANLEQIRQAVAMLDRQPRQLLVSVGQGTVVDERDAAVRGAATVGDDQIQVGVNRPPGDGTNVTVQARQGRQSADLHNVSSVTTLEGAETFIAVGQSAPLTTTQVSPGWAGSTVVETTEYRSASTGFYATARLSGDVVTLEVSPQQQRFSGSRPDRRIETAGVTTRVSGRMGEWMQVGASAGSSRSDASGLLTWGNRSDETSYGVWVKVEEVP
jgi:type II secretory pathway component GspD/PulD (secretin)